MTPGLVLKYLNGECFVIRPGYESTLHGSSWICLTVPFTPLSARSGTDSLELDAWIEMPSRTKLPPRIILEHQYQRPVVRTFADHIQCDPEVAQDP
jgi:hypothetical protein